MRIRVRYFAVVRERLRREEDELELPAGATVTAGMDRLCEREPVVGALRKHLQVAVNQQVVASDHVLADGDELALLPPVAGGSSVSRLARLQDGPLSLDEVIAAVSGPGMGGVVTFTGVVRTENQGHAVTRLEYEAYREMAERVLADILDELEREMPGVHAATIHRVGVLVPGDVAVVVAAAAAHRSEAFNACRAVIDRIKERAPIWKKEIGPSGETWVGLTP
jgi:molybdopterin synthase catalytic subunit